MSRFKTSVAVDVAAVLALLPADAFVHCLEWNAETGSVEVLWEHEKVVTGRDFPVEFPLGTLRNEQPVPAGIKILPGLKGKEPERAAETTQGTEGTEWTQEIPVSAPPEAELAAPAAVAVTQSPESPPVGTTEEKPVAKSRRGK